MRLYAYNTPRLRVPSRCRCPVWAQAHPTATDSAPKLRGVVEVTGGRQTVVPLDSRLARQQLQQQAGSAASSVAPTQADPLEALKTLFLPRGWPQSCTVDYLEYQLWSLPTHVFGWMSHSLATSSMLKVGLLGSGGAGLRLGQACTLKEVL